MDSDSRYTYNQQLQQALIDSLDDYTAKPYSKWLVGHKMGKNEDAYETRAIFVVSTYKLPSCHSLLPFKYKLKQSMYDQCCRASRLNPIDISFGFLPLGNDRHMRASEIEHTGPQPILDLL